MIAAFPNQIKPWRVSAWIDGIIFLMMTMIWIYVILRAIHVDLTHDEVLSLEMVQGKGGSFYTANNHWLNSGLIWIFVKLLGTAEWVLRLPSLIGFAIYSVFAWKWIKTLDPVTKFFAFALFFLNPYLLDFFSLARGYGLSMGLSLASIYTLISVNGLEGSKARIKTYALALIWALLGSMANLILINLVAIVGVFLLVGFWNERSYLMNAKNRKQLYGWIGLGLVICLIVFAEIKWLLFLKKSNELYFGGDRGFIDDTLSVLIHRYIYFQYYGKEFWLNLRSVVIVFFWACLVISLIIKKSVRWRWSMLVFAAFIGLVLIQFYGMEAKLPRERTSIIFYLLFVCSITSMLERISTAHARWKWTWIVILPLTAWMMVHFYKNSNLNRCFEWQADAGVAEKVNGMYRSGLTFDEMIQASEPELHPSIRYYYQKVTLDQ